MHKYLSEEVTGDLLVAITKENLTMPAEAAAVNTVKRIETLDQELERASNREALEMVEETMRVMGELRERGQFRGCIAMMAAIGMSSPANHWMKLLVIEVKMAMGSKDPVQLLIEPKPIIEQFLSTLERSRDALRKSLA